MQGVGKWEEVDVEQRKQLWKSLGLMEISSTTSFRQPFYCLRLSDCISVKAGIHYTFCAQIPGSNLQSGQINTSLQILGSGI